MTRSGRRWHLSVIFLFLSPAQILRERLISRKIAGGLSREDAEAFYARTDSPNVERVLVNSRQANLILEMTEEGNYHFIS